MTLNRVAVTGISALCGLGNNLEDVWSGLIQGKSGVSKLEGNLDSKNWPIQIAGLVKDFKISEDLLAPKEQSRFDLFIHYALHCANEAYYQAGLEQSDYNPFRVGSILGVGLGGFPYIEQTHQVFLERGARRVSPFFIPSFIPNMATGKIAMHFDLKGVNYAVSSACASGSHAIANAATEIMLGRQDAMITGGCESVLTGLSFAGFASMKALSKRNDDPTKASRPFDKDRDGFVMGEGAGILVLENYDKAKARGAKILAQIVAQSSTDDAYHVSSPHPDGESIIACMKMAIEDAKINKEEIGYLNAHGTSTPLGDIAETKAIKSVFKEHAYKMNISSTKSMTGHLLGAAGGLESVICIKSLVEKKIAPTINLDSPDEQCDLNYTPHQSQDLETKYILNNSFGFGGTNSTLIFKSEDI